MNKPYTNPKVGDEVICIEPVKSGYYLKKGERYKVKSVFTALEPDQYLIQLEPKDGYVEPLIFYSNRFELARPDLLAKSNSDLYDYELELEFQPVIIKTRNGMVTLFTDDNGTTVMAYEGMNMRDEADHAYQLTWTDKTLPVGKWMLWSEVDFSDEERYAIHAHSQMEIGCVSESTRDDMLKGLENPNVYKADSIEGASRLFDAADVISAAQKASGCNNCHLVFNITRV